jgi:hypothetical protein
MKKKLQSLLFLLAAASLAFAAEGPPSTDDQLRDSLNSRAGDDYDRALLGDPAKPDGKDRTAEEMQKRLQKELGAAAQREDKPAIPLLQVAKYMREVSPRLDRRDSGAETQFLQRQIVSDLAKLIEEAKKSGSCGGKNCSKPTGNGEKKSGNNTGQPSEKPARDSDPKSRHTPEQVHDAAKGAAALMKDLWAELQQREHRPVLDLPGEHFLPGYELEIEDYFRRLSEDRSDVEKP